MLFLWDQSCPVKIQSCISLFFSFSLKIEYYFIFFPLFQPLIVNVITVNFLMEQLLKIAQLVSNLASVFKFMRKKSVFSIFLQFQFSIFQIITSFIPQFSKLTDIIHLFCNSTNIILYMDKIIISQRTAIIFFKSELQCFSHY